MPFTLAHPLAILYFKKKFKKLSSTGLILGSMGPDLGYFTRFEIGSQIEHSWTKTCFVVIPLVILYSLAYHNFIKKILPSILPSYFTTRIIKWNEFDFWEYLRSNYFIFLISCIIGIYTHLIWDSFTHYNGYFVEKLPFLKFVMFQLPIFRILQFAFSILGLILLGFYFNNLNKTNFTQIKINKKYLIFIAFLFFSMILIRFFYFPVSYKIGNILLVPISSIFLSLTITGILSKMLSK